jgi:hypothetical protein
MVMEVDDEKHITYNLFVSRYQSLSVQELSENIATSTPLKVLSALKWLSLCTSVDSFLPFNL